MKILPLGLILLSWSFTPYAQQQTEDRATILVERMLSADPTLPSESYGLKIGDMVYFLSSDYFDDPIITDRRNLEDIEISLRRQGSWVTVVAPAEGMGRFGTYTVRTGEQCVPAAPIPIQVISFSPDGEFALIETLVESGGGTGCPLGSKFILPAEQLPAFRDEYQIRLQAMEERDAIVQQILSNNSNLPLESNGFHVGQIVYSPESQRIKLASRARSPYIDSSGIRPTGERSLLGTPRYTRPRQLTLEAESNCGIGDENRLEILGFSLDGEIALLENLTTHWDGNGPAPVCTKDARFLISITNLQQKFLEKRGFFHTILDAISW